MFVPTLPEVEPNDELPQAIGYLPGEDRLVIEGTFTGDYFTGPFDLDLYTVRVPFDGTFTATLAWDVPGADFDFVLVTESGDELYDAATVNNPEKFALPVEAGQELFFYVYAYEGVGDYVLDLRMVREVERADPLTPTDMGIVVPGPTQTFSGDLGGAARGWVLDWSGNDLADDEEADEWTFVPTFDGAVTVNLAFAADADFDLLVWSSPANDDLEGLLFDFAAASANNPEQITFAVSAGQPVYLSVIAYGFGAGDAGSRYSLTVGEAQ